MEQRIIRIYRPALSHSHVMRRIETGSTDIPNRSRQFCHAIQCVFRPKRIAVILHQPQTMLFTEFTDCFQVKRIAQCMCDHNRLRPLGQRLLQHRHIDIILWNCYIHKHRHRSILNDRSHRCRKSCRHRNDFITTPDRPLSQKRRSKRHKCEKIRRGTGIHQRTEFHPQIRRHLLLKFIRITPCCQPELQRTVHQINHLRTVIDSGRIGNPLSLLKRFPDVVPGITILPD